MDAKTYIAKARKRDQAIKELAAEAARVAMEQFPDRPLTAAEKARLNGIRAGKDETTAAFGWGSRIGQLAMRIVRAELGTGF